MGGAILPMLLAWRFAQRGKPLAAAAFPQHPEQTIARPLILGSLLFGVGWGLVGLCPRPALASVGYGGWQGAVLLVVMLTGMRALPAVLRRLDSPAVEA